MIGYSAREIFTAAEIKLRDDAERILEPMPWRIPGGDPFRCHEVTRAVAQILDKEGKFGSVCPNFVKSVRDGRWRQAYEHSWIELPENRILDVYAVGQLPQVQLVHLPIYAQPAEYRWLAVWPLRDDIKEDIVRRLIDIYTQWVTIGDVPKWFGRHNAQPAEEQV